MSLNYLQHNDLNIRWKGNNTMTTYELISTFVGILEVLIGFESLIITIIIISREDNKK